VIIHHVDASSGRRCSASERGYGEELPPVLIE
jgi:hypothetical protein